MGSASIVEGAAAAQQTFALFSAVVERAQAPEDEAAEAGETGSDAANDHSFLVRLGGNCRLFRSGLASAGGRAELWIREKEGGG